MANFNVSYFVKLRNQFSEPAKKVVSSANSINAKAKQLTRTLPKTQRQFKALATKVKSAGQAMSSFGASMALKVTAPLTLLGSVALKQSANLETLGVSFETMLGSAEKSKALMKDLLSFTATTPFQLQGVAQSSKQLLAFGVTQDNMIDRLRMLGDVSAGAGVPLRDMAQIFGKAKSKGKLMTEEILQMAERGVPIVSVLADGFGVTKQQIFEMASKSQISFDVMKKAMTSMTAKGGIFFDQTRKQSETLAGRWSTLKDNFLIAAAAIGDVLVESTGLNNVLKNMSEKLAPLAEKIKAFASEHPQITKLILGFTAFMVVLAPLLIIFGQLAFAIGAIIAIAPALASALAFGAIVAGVASVVVGAKILLDVFKDKMPNAFKLVSNIINASFSKVGDVIDGIISKAKEMIALIPSFDFGGGGGSGFFGDIASKIDAKAAEFNAQHFGAVEGGKSQTDINLSIKAPEGTIESIKSKTSGNTSNLGFNMRQG